MQHITITAVPPGQAPLWVRRQWRGVTMPFICQQEAQLLQRGVLGGPPCSNGGYVVSATVAIAQLRRVSPKASKWWEDHLPFLNTCELVFAARVCRISKPPRRTHH
jgi:hypothetical protein